MKKSAQVPGALIATIAAAVASQGCATNSQQCEDAYGNILPASACTGGGAAYRGGAHWVYSGGFGGGGSYGGGGSFGG